MDEFLLKVFGSREAQPSMRQLKDAAESRMRRSIDTAADVQEAVGFRSGALQQDTDLMRLMMRNAIHREGLGLDVAGISELRQEIRPIAAELDSDFVENFKQRKALNQAEFISNIFKFLR
jgi:hypothetical protein